MWKLRTSFYLKPFILFIATESDGSVYSTSFPRFSPTRPYGEREGKTRVGRLGERTWERGCGLFAFSSRRQVSREIQPKPELQTFLRVEGMSEIQANRFLSIDFHRFPLQIDKNHLIAYDFYRYRFLCNYTRKYIGVSLKGWQMGPYKPGQYQPSFQKILKKR